MTLRRGFLQGVRHFELTHAAPEKGELVAQFLGQYYQQAHGIPVEVICAPIAGRCALLEETLSGWKRDGSGSVNPAGRKTPTS
jgi:excinuclease ABC subunit C